VVFLTFQYKVESELGEVLAKTGKGYASLSREEKDEAGPPRPHLWLALLGFLASSDVGAQNKAGLRTLVDSFNEMEVEEVCEQVPMVKTARCYDGAYRKLLLAVPPQHKSLVVASLKQVGCKARWGRAPPGAMEREMSDWLAGLLGEQRTG